MFKLSVLVLTAAVSVTCLHLANGLPNSFNTSKSINLHFNSRCCKCGFKLVNLQRGWEDGFLEGVSANVGTAPTTGKYVNKKCNIPALLTIDFEKILKNNVNFGCLKNPYCGRRMLRIDLYMPGPRAGFTFNIGDSVSNNGWAGDGRHQQNDAEIHSINNNILVYTSDKCTIGSHETLLNATTGEAPSPVKKLTIYVSNEHVIIQNDNGLDYRLCDACLFALNGQSDNQRNGPNERVYLSLNRVVANTGRSGYGLCHAVLRWACPW